MTYDAFKIPDNLNRDRYGFGSAFAGGTCCWALCNRKFNPYWDEEECIFIRPGRNERIPRPFASFARGRKIDCPLDN